MYKNIRILLPAIVALAFILWGCQEARVPQEKEDIYKKGYNLPVKDEDREAAEAECSTFLQKTDKIYDIIYDIIYRENEADGQISTDTADNIMEILKETGRPISGERFSMNMSNYKEMEEFLNLLSKGEESDIVLYEILLDGGVGRRYFQFDGKDMYELYTSCKWDREGSPEVTMTSYTRLKEWKYTEKGWFCFEYCVPEPPEVTELVNATVMLRVKPLREDYREMAAKYLRPISYQGNNLFCSNWNADAMQDVDFNGVYQYFYEIEHQRKYKQPEDTEGIPKEEFENIMMQYLPVTAEQLRQTAVFDEKTQTYAYSEMGCGNHIVSAFGTSIPEIANMRENEDGTVTLTIDAVCEELGNDAVFSHELTVKFSEEGSVCYLRNKILGDGLKRIPHYRYRVMPNN